MVGPETIREMSVNLGVPLPVIEKDYVMGWLLWAIYNESSLQNNLVLKGGNCLRKIYFPDTRFSDDLDFTALELDSERIFHHRLDVICDMVSDAAGIVFDRDQTRVETKLIPDKDCSALDGRVYFKGFAGDSSITMRIKFDVSDYEKIVLPTQRLPIIHGYPDADQCKVLVLTYSLEEVLAEKLRSWIQRTRARDLFDAVKIIQSGAIPISKRQLLSTFLQKTIFKDIPTAGREEMLVDSKFVAVEDHWLRTIICPMSALIVAAQAISLFKDFIVALFQPEILGAIGAPLRPLRTYSYNVRSGIREAIVEAGRARRLVRMRYDGIERDIESYSFRYKITKEGYGGEYFYGFDRTRGNTIKSFLLERVQAVSILPQQYMPRWYVEF